MINRMLGLGFASPEILVPDANTMEHTIDERTKRFLELILTRFHEVNFRTFPTADLDEL